MTNEYTDAVKKIDESLTKLGFNSESDHYTNGVWYLNYINAEGVKLHVEVSMDE